LVIFPADLLSIPPLSPLEAHLFFCRGRLAGGGRPAVGPRAHLWETPVPPLGVCGTQIPDGGPRFVGPYSPRRLEGPRKLRGTRPEAYVSSVSGWGASPSSRARTTA
jgi:hypothetical protein